MSPEAKRLQDELHARGEAQTTSVECLPAGPPMTDTFPSPRRFVRTPGILVILYEGDPPRQIHTDGDTLVVETIGVQERAPMDSMGHVRSANSRMTERIRRRDYGHIDVQVQIDDPEYYSRPIRFKYTQTLVPDDDLLEWICAEKEKDQTHLR